MRNAISALAALPLLLALAACDNPAPYAGPDSSAPKPPVPGDTDAAKKPGSKSEADNGMRKDPKAAKTEAASASSAAPGDAAEPAKAGGDVPAPPDVAAPPADAEKSKTGLASKVLQKGTGTKKPKAADKVSVHYTGWTKDGKMFDSSVARGEPASFSLDGVIPGWTEGLQLMVEKEKRRFWIPADLAYGDKPSRPGAPTGQLTFDVELLTIVEAPPPPEVPKDVAAPSAGAKKTASGISYKVLTKGKGTEKPTADDTVIVHYSGWTKDGKMFDSSVTRGEPARFPLKRVIKGWTEGVQLMVVGEKTRFWIPADLAYGETAKRPGGPSGQLTFDIELIEIQKSK
jgi:FKBP-type peptidyl-prolyl cis-trans isomerase